MNSAYMLITGGLGGLGTAFAMECAHRGYNLLLVDPASGRRFGHRFPQTTVLNRYSIPLLQPGRPGRTEDLTGRNPKASNGLLRVD